MIRRLARDESGAVAVIFAIVFFVIVGVAALAVDVGYWYTAKRQLQTAADAAALAACADLARLKPARAIEDTAVDYAQRNFTAPLEPSESRVVAFGEEDGAPSHVAGNWVRVTVETDARVFLSHWLLNRGRTLIRAQAVAAVGHSAGVESPVPWGLTYIDVVKGLKAKLLGADGKESADDSVIDDPDDWAIDSEGYYVARFSQGSYGTLALYVTNGHDYEERFPDSTEGKQYPFPTVASLQSLEDGGLIQGLDTNRTSFLSGVSPTSVEVTVRLWRPLEPDEKVQASFDGKNAKDMTPDADGVSFSTEFEVGTVTKKYEARTITVTAGGKKPDKKKVTVIVRRLNYPLDRVEVHPLGVQDTDTAEVRVRPLRLTAIPAETKVEDLDEYPTYELKVEGGDGDYGSYLAVDFSTLDHLYSPCGYPSIGNSAGGGSGYEADIAGRSDVVAHLKDMLYTHQGDKVGKTRSGVEERLGGLPFKSLEEWWVTKSPSSPQLCVVPIIERLEPPSGRSRVIIVKFGTFFIEGMQGNNTVLGRFIDWTEGGWFVEDGDSDGSFDLKSVHLTGSHLQF